MTMDFYHSKYNSFLQNLEKLKPRLLLDIHLSKHTDVLLAMIIERCILQYCSTYRVVDMNKMTAALDMDMIRLESLLAKLIAEDRLLAKINSQTKTLVKQVPDAHNITTQKLLRLSQSYASQLKRDILQLSLLEHGFVVDSKEDELSAIKGSSTKRRNSSNSSQRKGMGRRNVGDEEDEDDMEDCNAEEEDDHMDVDVADSGTVNDVVMGEQAF